MMTYKVNALLSTIFLLLISCSNPTDISLDFNKSEHQANDSCTYTDGRYQKDIFEELTVHEDVQYGQGETMQKQLVDLEMDVFEPKDDTVALRPLVIWAHGGYFCFGDKANFKPLCEFVSHKGWVSATINYRKWQKRSVLPDSLEYLETAIRATHDMHAAIRFFKEDAAGKNLYKIDTTKIFVGGYSAGGIMAAQVAYLDEMKEVPMHIQNVLEKNGGIEGHNAQKSSNVAGCIVIAGAVYNTNILTKGRRVPFLGIQGTKDEIVPYKRGWAHSPMGTKVIELEGTAMIHEMNNKLGVPSSLLALDNGNHNAAWEAKWQKRTLQAIHTFLLENTCSKED